MVFFEFLKLLRYESCVSVRRSEIPVRFQDRNLFIILYKGKISRIEVYKNIALKYISYTCIYILIVQIFSVPQQMKL
jgi:hypothetical protein